MRSISLALSFFAAAAAVGCDNVPSDEVTTDDMRLFVTAEVDADGGGDVIAQLTTDNEALLEETFINLERGDRLTADIDGTRLTMREEYVAPLGIYQYRASFDGVIPGAVLSVELFRPTEEDALDTSIEIPPSFEIDGMPASFSRAAGVAVSWSAQSAEGRVDRSVVRANGACIEAYQEVLEGNPGTAEVVGLVSPGGGSCPVSIEVVLVRDSDDVDPAFGRGGSIRANQVRRLSVTAEP